jgi:O-acetyl-ADP-ribose deacetylase
MISVVLGDLVESEAEGVLRPVRSDLAPVTIPARDLLLRAGAAVAERLEKVGSVPLGGAVITQAGDLASDFLIHVVVSSRDENESTMSVQRALRNGLRRAVDWGVATLALPPLGMGVGAMAPEDSARVMIEILRNHLAEGEPPLHLTIVVTSEYEEEIFGRLLTEESDSGGDVVR